MSHPIEFSDDDKLSVRYPVLIGPNGVITGVRVLAWSFVDNPNHIEVHSSPEATDADRDSLVAYMLTR